MAPPSNESPVVIGLRAMQLADTMLPVGSFSFSNGLETAVAEGLVDGPETLREFVFASVYQGARCDGIALLHAFRAARSVDVEGAREADEAVLLRKLNEEARTMTTRMGRKMAELGIRLMPESGLLVERLDDIRAGRTPGTYPAIQGAVLAESGTTEELAFGVHQFGLAATLLGAALRIVRVDHLDAQKILFDVNATAADDYAAVRDRGLDDMSSFMPMFDIFAAIHVGSHVRMFMN